MNRTLWLSILVLAPICCCFGRLSVGMQGTDLGVAEDVILLRRLPTLTVTASPVPPTPTAVELVAAETPTSTAAPATTTPVPVESSPQLIAAAVLPSPTLLVLPPTFTPSPTLLPLPVFIPTPTPTPTFTPTPLPASGGDSGGGGSSSNPAPPTATFTPAPAPPPGISFNAASYSISENDAAGQITVGVDLGAAAPYTVSVHIQTADNTATGGADYSPVSTTLTMTPGMTGTSVTISITNDTFAEADETVNLTLSNPVSGTLGTASVVLTIVSDELLNQLTDTSGCSPTALNPSMSADGSAMVFASNCSLQGSNSDGNYELFLYSGGSLTQLTDTSGCAGSSFRPQLSSDGSRVVFAADCDPLPGNPNADGNSEIFLYNVGSGTLTQLTTTAGCSSSAPSLTGNGNQVAFVSTCDLVSGSNGDGSAELFLDTISTSTRSQLTNDASSGCTVGWPAISSDGSQIAFVANCDPTGGNGDGNQELFTYDGAINQLTSTSGCSVNAPVISSNGSVAAFSSTCNPAGSSNSDGSEEVFVANTGSSVVTQLSDSSGCAASAPAISAGGGQVGFSSSCNLVGSNSDGSREIFVADTGTSAIAQITSATGCDALSPAVSATSAQVSFASTCDSLGTNTDGNLELFLASLN